MKSLSLKWKIVLASGVPLLFFVGFCLNQIMHINNLKMDAQKTEDRVGVINAISSVVHETQKERGKTAIYLGGKTDFATLDAQRNVNNEKIEAFREILPNSPFPEKYKQELQQNLKKLEALREEVAAKSIPINEALGAYSAVIKRFLDTELYVANSTSLSNIAGQLTGFRIIEDAKESGGKLRANMAGVLSVDGPIDKSKFALIIKLKAGVDTNLGSSALNLGDDGQAYVERFITSAEWETVNTVFAKILKNADSGNYESDPSEFFNVITGALNILGELVEFQKADLLEKIQLEKNQTEEKLKNFSTFLLAVVLALCGFIFYIVKLANESIKVIKSIGERVASEVNEIRDVSDSMSEVSDSVNSSSSEQAAGLQQTVAAVNEISSMVQKNAESASISSENSDRSNTVATKGKETVQNMMSSIEDISQNNKEVVKEMNENNKDIEKIANVIAEIGNKTKVINDIVFQTKLLSFNASVEAARAGEHGKGFAVVAEEVGNLASMSGKSALEISELIESSTKQVSAIVESSAKKMDRLISTSNEKVDSGLKTAMDCDKALDEILQNVGKVNELVKQIASASSEQSSGVDEISKAMNRLDQITHKNTMSARTASDISHDLKEKASSLTLAVKELMDTVDGKNVKQSTKSDKHNKVSQDGNQPGNVVNIPNQNGQEAQIDKPAVQGDVQKRVIGG